ncbi:MAG: 3-oxoacyl-[acyl-carrier-protein] synthase III C-terminal domain-containing protein [Patescibacteria group bacterium]
MVLAESRPSVSYGVYKPALVLTNETIESWRVEVSSGQFLTAQSILQKTGIERRFHAAEDETVVDMALKVAEDVLAENQVDLILVSTSFPIGVNVATEVLRKLHLTGGRLDIYAACSGFVRGLVFLKQNEDTFRGRRVFFLASEKYSDKLVDLREEEAIKRDPSLSQTIFSDGAAGLSFILGVNFNILAAESRMIDKVTNLIRMPINWQLVREPFINEPVDRSHDGKFRQEGPAVYRQVLERIPQALGEFMAKYGIDPNEVGYIVPHQGSGRMVRALAERLTPSFKAGQVVEDFKDGNFSSASIPKALVKLIQEDRLDPGKITLLLGFGAGRGLLGSIAACRIGG